MSPMHRPMSVNGCSACALAVALVLGGCATRGTQVVLLPGQNEAPTAVVVRSKGGEVVVDRSYAQASVTTRPDAVPTVRQLSREQVSAKNETLFALAPPQAQRFTLYFNAGGLALTNASDQALMRAVVAASARAGGELVVTGHTDTTGISQANDKLSLERAEQVRRMLVEQGFPNERIETVGRGSRALAVPTADQVDEPRNRRVEITVR